MAKTYKCLKEFGYVQNGQRTWTTATVVTTTDWVRPTTPNGYIYECTTGGTTSGSTEPTWPTTPGNTVNDNGVVWTCRAITPTYIVPSTTKGFIGKLRLNNTGASTCNVDIHIVVNSGGSAGIANNANKGWNIQLDPYEQIVMGDAEFPDVMNNAGDTLQVFGEKKDQVTVRISGIEE